MPERLWHIQQCDLFALLPPEQFALLERSARMRRYARGEPVYLPSDASSSIFLLAEGRIKLASITPDGKQAILAFVEAGELFGEMSLLAQAQREEFAEAMTTATVVQVTRDAFERVMHETPRLALGVTKLIGLRRQRIERRLRSLLFRSNRDRLIQFLLELAERYGKPTSEGIYLAIPLSHQEIASVIGSTRETVTHLLGELQLARLLKVARQKIVVRDLPRLAAEVGVAPPDLEAPGPPAALRPAPLPKFPTPS